MSPTVWWRIGESAVSADRLPPAALVAQGCLGVRAVRVPEGPPVCQSALGDIGRWLGLVDRRAHGRRKGKHDALARRHYNGRDAGGCDADRDGRRAGDLKLRCEAD